MIKINIEEDRSYETVVITDHTEDDYYKLCSALFTITSAALRQNFTPEQIKSAMEYAEEVVRKARREIQEKNKRKVLHISIDIEGALKCPEDFIGCLIDDNGRELTDVEEIKAVFRHELELGHRLMPTSGCKNFDPQRGCLGCEIEEDNESSHGFKVGEYIIYKNGQSYEIGRIKRIVEDGAFVCYSGGETAAKTPFDCMHKIVNGYTIKRTTLGGECF